MDGVQIAQSTGTVLEIGLQFISAVIQAQMTLSLLEDLGVKKSQRVKACLKNRAEGLKQTRIAP